MDDDRTQQTLDDLADLFLTGTAPQPPRRDALDGPEPIRLRPSFVPSAPAAVKPAPDPAREADPPVADRSEEQADFKPVASLAKPHELRLTSELIEPVGTRPENDPPENGVAVLSESADRNGDERRKRYGYQPSDPDAVRPHIEAVLLGNLPGLAHAWLTQYAQLLAQRDGPVLLLTVDDGTPGGVLEAELIEPALRDVLHHIRADEPDDDLWDDLVPGRGAATESRSAPPTAQGIRDVLDDLLYKRDQPLATVLIYTDTDPAQIDRLLDVGVWTLLTGADETAVVAGHRGLELLAAADPDAPGASVGVFVMGSPQERAESAAQKIAGACDALFDTSVEPLGHLQKMRPAAVRTLGRFPGIETQWNELLDALAELPADDVAAIEPLAEPFTEVAPEPAPPSPFAQAPQEAIDDRYLQVDEFSSVPAAAVGDGGVDSPDPSTLVADGDPNHESDLAVADVAGIGESLVPDQVPDAPGASVDEASNDAGPPDLPGLLTAALPAMALRALPARGPDHPDIVLALDTEGRLHLLLRLQDAEHPRVALLELCDARRWAVRHRALLRLAAPAERELDPSRAPAVHLFTDRPDQAVPLAATIDPNIKLHLLQHLPLSSGPSWLATPLQAEG